MYLSDYHKIARLAYPTYAVILIMPAVVLLWGNRAAGLSDGFPSDHFAFQPSEFAKLVLVLVLANYYSRHRAWDGCIGWCCRA